MAHRLGETDVLIEVECTSTEYEVVPLARALEVVDLAARGIEVGAGDLVSTYQSGLPPCGWKGKVDARADGGMVTWLCPRCETEHQEAEADA